MSLVVTGGIRKIGGGSLPPNCSLSRPISSLGRWYCLGNRSVRITNTTDSRPLNSSRYACNKTSHPLRCCHVNTERKMNASLGRCSRGSARAGSNLSVSMGSWRTRSLLGGTPAFAKVPRLKELGTQISSTCQLLCTQLGGSPSVSNMVRQITRSAGTLGNGSAQAR